MFTLSEYISFSQEFSPRLIRTFYKKKRYITVIGKQTNENYVCSMTNSEFSNFFETFYLQEVNKANRAKFVCHNQDSLH